MLLLMRNLSALMFICICPLSAASDVDFLQDDDLVHVGETPRGGLSILEDENNVRWVVRDNLPISSERYLPYLVDPYVTSKLLRFLLKESHIPVVTEVAIVSGGGTASKWLDGFVPLETYYYNETNWNIDDPTHYEDKFFWHTGAVPPRKIKGHPILQRERLILALDFVGVIDRNPTNLGVVIKGDQYFAAQIDYDESFDFQKFAGIRHFKNILDINETLKEIDRIILIPTNLIDFVVEDAKQKLIQLLPKIRISKTHGDFRGLSHEQAVERIAVFIGKHLDGVKKDLAAQKSELKNLRKDLEIHLRSAHKNCRTGLLSYVWMPAFAGMTNLP